MNKYIDVILKVNDLRIPAHRNLLAVTIPYFNGMFTNDTAESQNKEVVIEGVEAHALKSLINFVYTGEVRIDAQNVENLMQGASYLLLPDVQKACAKFMTSEMTPHNVLGIRELADALSCTHLLKSAKKFIKKNFDEVTKTEEFVSLNFDKFVELCGSNEINVHNEDIRFEECIRWIKYDEKIRTFLLPTVFSTIQIRLPLLSSELLVDCVKRAEQLQSLQECRDLINEAEQIYSSLGNLTLVGFSDEWKFLVAIYDRILNKWKICNRFSFQWKVSVNCSEKAVFMDGKFYIFYYDTSADVVRCNVYDINTKTKSQFKGPSITREMFSVGASDGRIYICGGRDCNHNTLECYDDVECFSLETGQWTKIAPLPTRIRNPGVAVLNGKFYICGGYTGFWTRKFFRCGSTTSKWIELTPMNNALRYPSVATVDGKLYVMGTNSNNKIIEVYNPTTNTWETAMKRNCKEGCKMTLCDFMGDLWIVTDAKSWKSKITTEIYNTKTKKWRCGPSINEMKTCLGFGILK